jgi:hypothetical protein
MTHVNMPEAETTLSELVEKAERGEDVAIWRNWSSKSFSALDISQPLG